MKLSSLDSVKKDMKLFNEYKDKMPNEKATDAYNNLYIEYKTLLSRIDDAHNMSYNGYVKPSMLKDNRNKLVEIRSALHNMIKGSTNV